MKTLRKALICFSVLVLLVSALPLAAFSADATEIKISLSGPDTVYKSSEFKITVNFSLPSYPVAGLEFSLAFDKNSLTPLVTDNSSGALSAFAAELPNGWDQMSYYSEAEGKYYLRFADEGGNHPLKKASDLVLEIPFAASEAGDFTVTVADEDIICISDTDLKPHSGKGSEFTAFVFGDSEKFSVTLSADTVCSSGDVCEINIAATNLGDKTGIIAFEFALFYDNNVFSPIYTENGNGEMDIFLSDLPNNSWEQMCSFYPEENKYILRFAALNVGDDKAEILNQSESAVIKIPFKIIGAEGDIGNISIPHSSVLSVNVASAVLSGIGSSASYGITESVGLPAIDKKYKVIDNLYITGVIENTDASDMLHEFIGFSVEDASGKPKAKGVVCTGDMLVYDGTKLIICVRGDASGNGKVDSRDYALVKRCVLGTYEFDDAQKYATALRNGVYPVAYDYGLIKRHVLNTYNING